MVCLREILPFNYSMKIGENSHNLWKIGVYTQGKLNVFGGKGLFVLIL